MYVTSPVAASVTLAPVIAIVITGVVPTLPVSVRPSVDSVQVTSPPSASSCVSRPAFDSLIAASKSAGTSLPYVTTSVFVSVALSVESVSVPSSGEASTFALDKPSSSTVAWFTVFTTGTESACSVIVTVALDLSPSPSSIWYVKLSVVDVLPAPAFGVYVNLPVAASYVTVPCAGCVSTVTTTFGALSVSTPSAPNSSLPSASISIGAPSVACVAVSACACGTSSSTVTVNVLSTLRFCLSVTV